MDRVEFIQRTYMNDSIRANIIQCFWNQYMLLYELGADSIESVMPINSGDSIRFQIKMINPEAVSRIIELIQQAPVCNIYCKEYKVFAVANMDDCSVLIDIV